MKIIGLYLHRLCHRHRCYRVLLLRRPMFVTILPGFLTVFLLCSDGVLPFGEPLFFAPRGGRSCAAARSAGFAAGRGFFFGAVRRRRSLSAASILRNFSC